MKQDDICQALIDGTIRVVAREGLAKTTTKLVATTAGVNEVNIYRMYKGKEDLLKNTFASLDRELIHTILNRLPVMNMTEIDIKERAWMLFAGIWKFLLGNADKCLCFMQYYYSPYFRQYSYEEHKRAYEPVTEAFRPAFVKGADVWMLLNHILDMMLNSAVKVFQGDLTNDEKTAEQLFELIYASMSSWLVWNAKVS